jgi:hypothetical protein
MLRDLTFHWFRNIVIGIVTTVANKSLNLHNNLLLNVYYEQIFFLQSKDILRHRVNCKNRRMRVNNQMNDMIVYSETTRIGRKWLWQISTTILVLTCRY